MAGIIKRIWLSISNFGREQHDQSSLSSNDSNLKTSRYPSEPPTVSLSLSLSSNTCSPGEEIYLFLSVFNETSFPITVGFGSSSILAVTRSARVDAQCMIEVRDMETGEELPRRPWICAGGEVQVSKDYEDCFLTISAWSTHVERGYLVKHGDLKAGHVYIITFSNPKLPWWQYGTKEEVLMPGTEEQEKIWRKTGRDPCLNYEAYWKDPYHTEPEMNIRITGQPPKLTCL